MENDILKLQKTFKDIDKAIALMTGLESTKVSFNFKDLDLYILGRLEEYDTDLEKTLLLDHVSEAFRNCLKRRYGL